MNTNAVTQNENNTVTSNYAATGKTAKANYGSTVGAPELSDSAAKYYEQLKKKYSGMDFVLVSEEKKSQAQENVGSYANANRTVVLIDTDKIEKMASDESYRKQYEGIISGATSQLSELKSSLGSNESSVKTYGMQVNDGGTVSFFAVIDISQTEQKKRIEKNAAKNAEEKKTSAEKASEKLTKKATEQKVADNESKTDKADKTDKTDKTEGDYSKNTVTVTASSIEELIKKINDTLYENMSNHVETDNEKQVGKNIDFSA
ncbi:DUF6033 family protein [[Clostridium] fimetarium]|uniref:Uncharacterized protein n=1 Tax=[Clostridium] fimetarium TaxID=99656 RepID=A0A1I0NQW9_9FIRM|nr:DUF6033 family protein [[Clostridium] fimetarium]SEW03807.1 hypothetical protein SAMN05421659_103300 [[Clostridium] fimetarium]